MRRHPDFSGGFSLLEVTIALGIAAFCLITLLGLLPLGMQTNQSAISQTAAASVLSSVVADLRATPKANPTSPQYDIMFGTEKLLTLRTRKSVRRRSERSSKVPDMILPAPARRSICADFVS